MSQIRPLARTTFALGIIGLGALGVVYGDFASSWPSWVPWRQPLLYAASAIMLLGGAGLLLTRTARIAVRLLLPYLLIWMALRIPYVVKAPQVEVNWLAVGEVAVLAAGAWALFAELGGASDGASLQFATGDRGRLVARLLLGLSLVWFGLSHFFYLKQTVSLIPAYFPFPTGWAYLTGAAHAAAGLGVLLSIYPRLAATMEAAMLGIFTALVWIPAVVTAPKVQGNWSEFVLSWAIGAGAWVVAGSIPAKGETQRV